MSEAADPTSFWQDEKELSRREFARHMLVGWGSLSLIAGISVVGVMRFLLPNVLYEPPTVFRVGFPEAFPEGVTPIPGRNVFLVRNGSSFHAISSICTHLRCQVGHVRNGFQCPCHGSRFDIDGEVIRGAAPRPLDWYEVTLAENGEIRVNTKRKVKPGTESVLFG
jgi:cytochrome b6-f complex iron-sulfur subunit